MQFNFQQIIDALNENLPQSDNFAMRIARGSRVPGDYLGLSQILPMEMRPDYHVDGATMTIFPTMLGQVSMDEPYPPMGAMSSSQFFENTTKLGGSMFFSEKAQRDLQAWSEKIISLGVMDGQSTSAIFGDLSVGADGRGDANTVNGRRLNAVLGLARMIRQSHWDTYEHLIFRALATGEIDWTFGEIPLKVDYKVPAANVFTPRTGNDAYQGSTSKFWVDMRALHTKLNGFRIIMNSATWYSIINNSVNNIRVVVNEGMNRELVQIVGTTETNSTDVRDRVRITIYDKGGTLIDAKPGTADSARLISVPFLKNGEIVVVGEQKPDGFELLDGAVSDPDNTLRLGYTHVAPTIEGQGRPGIFARIYTPEQKPYQILAETAVNMLPVILNPKKLVILNSTVS